VKQAIRNNAEIERLQVEIGEMKLVLESQDLRLKEWHAEIERLKQFNTSERGAHLSWKAAAHDYESEVERLEGLIYDHCLKRDDGTDPLVDEAWRIARKREGR
jgi:predicted  nucleic acid-binding Zn-ribbon protein